MSRNFLCVVVFGIVMHLGDVASAASPWRLSFKTEKVGYQPDQGPFVKLTGKISTPCRDKYHLVISGTQSEKEIMMRIVIAAHLAGKLLDVQILDATNVPVACSNGWTRIKGAVLRQKQHCSFSLLEVDA